MGSGFLVWPACAVLCWRVASVDADRWIETHRFGACCKPSLRESGYLQQSIGCEFSPGGIGVGSSWKARKAA
ncbi:hypothetical protein BO86DRAFT_389388 [Aspergillus japonicus CBS 114.51]|uniref:Secreted protein n=1 Tax=Aspergillus japonicus CBS 114.51 TaxID=1448312 RepID=A0A8T8X1Z3_ASPJA|nr:hypothetical protein BO86DRAFT_389388 [Aspergillus japonicus CBS 114.51]RAH81652.1 hypothetical protein BO86DRAFT_389388 [Aspergillus japonicus CBS 114.51]